MAHACEWVNEDVWKVREAFRKDVSGGLFRNLVEKVITLYNEYLELREEQDKILKEISKLGDFRGSLVYKWVRNKAGKQYWYWYLHVKENGRTRSIYLGRELHESFFKARRERERKRALEKRLKEISSRILEIEDKVKRASINL